MGVGVREGKERKREGKGTFMTEQTGSIWLAISEMYENYSVGTRYSIDAKTILENEAKKIFSKP